jgi:hypothetical protein
MIIRKGEKIHVIHRPFYKGDTHRHFIGEVEECTEGLARATGYVYALNSTTYAFTKRDNVRSRIIPLTSGHVITNILPKAVDIENLTYESHKGFLRLTDGSDWYMDICYEH